jgi:hypothetical protein
MHASSRLYLVERSSKPPAKLGEVVLWGCFQGLCAILRRAAELYDIGESTTHRETPPWQLGAGQIAPVVAGRWPLNDQ